MLFILNYIKIKDYTNDDEKDIVYTKLISIVVIHFGPVD